MKQPNFAYKISKINFLNLLIQYKMIERKLICFLCIAFTGSGLQRIVT